ncbi:MAG: hypothetical protein NVSMB25_10800 [Thermoleophilaceae bacterium]
MSFHEPPDSQGSATAFVHAILALAPQQFGEWPNGRLHPPDITILSPFQRFTQKWEDGEILGASGGLLAADDVA